MSNIPGINPSALPNAQSGAKKSQAGQESIKGLSDDMAGVLAAGKKANLNPESAATIQGKTTQQQRPQGQERSEEHTSELQSQSKSRMPSSA